MNRNSLLTFISIILFTFSPNYILGSSNQSFESTLTYPGETCNTQPLGKWTEQEKWVWKQICEDKEADLLNYLRKTDDYQKQEDWVNNQKLSSDFLKTILLYDPFRSALRNKVVHISKAWFAEKLDLSNSELNNVMVLAIGSF